MCGRKRPLSIIKDQRAISAVEFALIAPVLILLVFGIVSFGTILATYNGVQQLAAEAARSSIAGLSNAERAQLAQAYVTQNVKAYPFIDPNKVQVTTSSQSMTFQVTVAYDMSGSYVFTFGKLIPLVTPVVQRSAAIQFGGY